MILESCEDCKMKRCEFDGLYQNLLFCYSYSVNGGFLGFEREDYFEFTVSPTYINLFRNEILIDQYDFKGKRSEFYFEEIITDDKLIAKNLLDIFESIGCDIKILTKNKPKKVIDVQSFLAIRKYAMMNINYPKMVKFAEHGIIFKEFDSSL